MSLPWRTWLRLQSNQKLGITQKERDIMEQKHHVFCGFYNSTIRDEAGKGADVDRIFDAMPDEQKLEFASEVIEKGLVLLKVRKKKISEEPEQTQETAQEIREE